MTKSIFASIVGHTNAGKSSLLNDIIGEKIAAVSEKPQTTRTRITGIKTIGEVQIVFIDTPGLHKANTKLSNHMLGAVDGAVSDGDIVIFVQDCTKAISPQEEALLARLEKAKTPVILVLNKIDLYREKTGLIELIATWNKKYHFVATVPLSAKTGDGVDALLEEVCAQAVESVHFFPDDKITDQSEQVLAAEFIREKILLFLRDEVPHGVAVVVERMAERDDRDLLDIDAMIYCEKESHKGIIIGKGGAMLRRIATAAREELERFFCIQVNLQCRVKVKEGWRNRETLIRNFGLGDE